MLLRISLSVLLMGCASAAPVPASVYQRDLLGLGKGTGLPLQSGCTGNGRSGQLLEGLCVLSDISLVTRDDSAGDGETCQLINGAPGVWQYGICVRAGTNLYKKDLLHLNQGQPCEGAYGSGFWNEGLCVPILDGVIDIEPQNGLLKQEPLLDGTSCWHNGRLGHVKHDLCLLDDLLNISLKKRSDDLLDGNHLLTAGLELTGLEETGHRGSLLALRQLERGPYDDDDFAPNPDTGINAERDLPLGEGDGLGGLTGLVRNLGSVLGGASPVGTGLPGGLGLK